MAAEVIPITDPRWRVQPVPAVCPEMPLPMTRHEMDQRGWDACDIVLITGNAYVDHPSFGTALVGRWLEYLGYRVGIIAQPDPQRIETGERGQSAHMCKEGKGGGPRISVLIWVRRKQAHVSTFAIQNWQPDGRIETVFASTVFASALDTPDCFPLSLPSWSRLFRQIPPAVAHESTAEKSGERGEENGQPEKSALIT